MKRNRPSGPVHTGVTRHSSYEDDRISVAQGDEIRVTFPWSGVSTKVTFNAYVVPDRGVPYLEVYDKIGVSRCIRPEAVKPSRRKRRAK